MERSDNTTMSRCVLLSQINLKLKLSSIATHGRTKGGNAIFEPPNDKPVTSTAESRQTLVVHVRWPRRLGVLVNFTKTEFIIPLWHDASPDARPTQRRHA
jgi:hypothetical protein